MAKNSVDVGLQELEECQALKWLLSAEDAAALGGVVKGSSQSPLFSGFWSQAHCIESRITLTGFAGVCCRFFCWEDVGWELERLFLVFAVESFMFMTRDMSELFFFCSTVACCKEIVPNLQA